jgi:hypothetical protein
LAHKVFNCSPSWWYKLPWASVHTSSSRKASADNSAVLCCPSPRAFENLTLADTVAILIAPSPFQVVDKEWVGVGFNPPLGQWLAVQVLDVPLIYPWLVCLQLEQDLADVLTYPPMGGPWASAGNITRLTALDYYFIGHAVIGAAKGHIPLTRLQNPHRDS